MLGAPGLRPWGWEHRRSQRMGELPQQLGLSAGQLGSCQLGSWACHAHEA